MHRIRQSPYDLEIAGEVPGLRAGDAGFLRWSDLRRLPQVSGVVDDDPDLPGLVMKITGVRLDVLAKALGVGAAVDLLDALCSDGYRAYYPRELIAAHQPLLVLTMDGMTPAAWAAKTKQDDPGPYLILYRGFRPAWRVLSHADRPQLPSNVVRLNFGRQVEAWRAVEPGAAASLEASQGYQIARQNCVRCHAAGATGGTKSKFTWADLARDARQRPAWFATYVAAPKKISPQATMPGEPGYDAATLGALTAYFKNTSSSVEGRER
ncbi:MAG: hypothetical protein M3O02_10175 [Acidobacteriota bacterium]|nr:hypothetical protein [Acidobacteriota bacterium]